MGAHNFIDLSGLTFGRLTVIEQTARRRKKVPRWTCRCICGSITVVEGKNLRGGLTTSCGCFAREVTSQNTRTHGQTESPTYKTWCAIKRRCYNKNERAYDRYGGSGIKVCARWLASFENFYEDMGPHPGPGYSIERVNPHGHYEPTNCRWLTMREQASNKRNTVKLTLRDQTRTMVEWAALTGIPYPTMQARRLRGWTDEKVIATPLATNRRNRFAGSRST